MTDLAQTIHNGAGNLWLFIPTAVLLGGLHGLEPGHSKTMMAAFIIAIRGTIAQAVLLGLSAAVSHSLIIWALAAGALRFGSRWNAETVEPYLQLVSAVAILSLAAWMFFRTRRDVRLAAEHAAAHHHGHTHDAAHRIEAGRNRLLLTVFEDGVPPVFRLAPIAGSALPEASDVTVETLRPHGERQSFSFQRGSDFLESKEAIPEPHEFEAKVRVRERDQTHEVAATFTEEAHHGDSDFSDEHEREHAADIAKRFAGRTVTTPQIVLFGVTGGLMPCPAAFTVLLVCLQLKRVVLGFAMVGAFSFGLALTMVASGVIAAWSVRHAEKRFRGFGELARRAPYISCGLLVLMAAYMAWQGVTHLR